MPEFCSNCGNKVGDAKFCASCGKEAAGNVGGSKPKTSSSKSSKKPWYLKWWAMLFLYPIVIPYYVWFKSKWSVKAKKYF